jgi:hypothetical protein
MRKCLIPGMPPCCVHTLQAQNDHIPDSPEKGVKRRFKRKESSAQSSAVE